MADRSELPSSVGKPIEELLAGEYRLPEEGVNLPSHPYFQDVLPAAGFILTQEQRDERDDT